MHLFVLFILFHNKEYGHLSFIKNKEKVRLILVFNNLNAHPPKIKKN